MPVPDDEVFSRAIELPQPDQQDQYIEEVCVSDPGQKKRLLTLLRTHRRMEQRGGISILERASEQLDSLTTESEPLPGTLIDRFRLVEKLGEGGMGIVFAAEQVRREHNTGAMGTQHRCHALDGKGLGRQNAVPWKFRSVLCV